MSSEEGTKLHSKSDIKPHTLESLLEALDGLLKEWPACDHEPEGMACKYHNDLERVVIEHGGAGCGCGAHSDQPGGQEPVFSGPGPIREPAAEE